MLHQEKEHQYYNIVTGYKSLYLLSYYKIENLVNEATFDMIKLHIRIGIFDPQIPFLSSISFELRIKHVTNFGNFFGNV